MSVSSNSSAAVGSCLAVSSNNGVNSRDDGTPVLVPALATRRTAEGRSITLLTECANSARNTSLSKTKIDSAYDVITIWRRNLFQIPTGSAGKLFVTELAILLDAFAKNHRTSDFAMKAAMVLPALCLQKPSRNSKAKDHAACLERRLALWKSGDIASLVREGKAIQERIPTTQVLNQEDAARRGFTRAMFNGHVGKALRCLSQASSGGVLNPDDDSGTGGRTVLQELLGKHPDAQPAPAHTLLQGPAETISPVIFDEIDGNCVRATSLRLSGAAGISGMDSDAWKRMCTSFSGASKALCNAVALVAKKLATETVPFERIDCLLAGKLFALDKKPGVRPIGIGEVLRRLIAKLILHVTKANIMSSAGSLQLCAGQEAGAEAAVHAMRRIFDDDDTDGILLVDASNAFNSINRQAMLHNVNLLCPHVAKIAANFYQQPSSLHLGNRVILSQEGTTQGDPLAMPLYALAVLPIITRLSADPDSSVAKQAWFADDAGAGAKLRALRQWWDLLVQVGPSFGYHPNASKTWLVVKPDHLQEARVVFDGSGVQITAEGRPYLGAPIGSDAFCNQFIANRITSYCQEISTLANIAAAEPQCAYAAFVHGVRHRWNYLFRTTPLQPAALEPLENCLAEQFIPILCAQAGVPANIRAIMEVPIGKGGMGIISPAKSAPVQHQTSINVTSSLTQMIISQCAGLEGLNAEGIAEAKKLGVDMKAEVSTTILRDNTPNLNREQQRMLEAVQERGASTWLSCLPISHMGFVLNRQAFTDAMAMRYCLPIPDLPSKCVCGEDFSTQHAMSCLTGGLATARHDHVRDLLAAKVSDVAKPVQVEPRLLPLPNGLTLPRPG